MSSGAVPASGGLYAIWLCPDEATSALLQPHTKALAARFQGHEFPSHITIASGRYTDKCELAAWNKAARELLPLTLAMEGVAWGEAFFTSIYLTFAKGAELMSLREAGCRFTEKDGPWHPHLSLTYTDASLAEKQRAATSLLLPRKRLVFDRLEIWGPKPGYTWRDVSRWQRLIPSVKAT